jgi:2'-5' RNA ligase
VNSGDRPGSGRQARGERARLFVALELPDEIRAALATWAASAGEGIHDLRLVAADALHVTLCFLGSLPVGEITPIGEACAESVGGFGAAELSLGQAVWLPARRPHVLAVGINDSAGALAPLHAALSDALARGDWYRPEARPFLAHTTVGRVGHGARLRAVELPAPPELAFPGCTVTLFRSRTDPRGARYEPLSRVELSTPGSPSQ